MLRAAVNLCTVEPRLSGHLLTGRFQNLEIP